MPTGCVMQKNSKTFSQTLLRRPLDTSGGGISHVKISETSDPKGRLGNKRQYFSGHEGGKTPRVAKNTNKIRREAAADQRQAAVIFNSKRDAIEAVGGDAGGLAGRGVCLCGWTQIAEQESALKRVQRDGRQHAFISGAQMCGLRWVCPICTAKRANDDKNFVNDGLAAARKKLRMFPVMMTLTTRHTKKEAAVDVLRGIVRAEQKLKTSKPWKRLKEKLVGYARVLEWTYGKNGHHPHFHTILLVQAESEEGAVAAVEELHAAYMYQLAAAGRDGTSNAAWKRSFQVQGASAAEGYITKWGSAEELTGAQKKDGGEGMTPWQLLRSSRDHEDENERMRCGQIWWEIIQATKGKAQLYKSEGFKRLVEEYRADNEPEPEPEPEVVLDLGVRDKGFMITLRFEKARVRTLALREAVERIDDLVTARATAELLLDIGETDGEIFDKMKPDDVELIDRDDS